LNLICRPLGARFRPVTRRSAITLSFSCNDPAMNRIILLALLVGVAAFAQGSREQAHAIFEGAMLKMRQAGGLAQQGKFAPANELIGAASAEFDRAVEMAPDDIELRARRGLAYARMAFLPGKAEISAADLRLVRNDPGFESLPADLRASVSAVVEGTPRDRFPQVPADTAPVIAVVSFTLPPGTNGAVPDWVRWTRGAMEGYPGLLGTHAMASVDRPGMYLVFTWWADKKALNDFFYGDLHQSWVRRRGVTMSTNVAVAPQDMPTQTAAEVFSGLPGGVQINGGFAPESVVEWQNKAK
jgi:heme-degrading monooxygenase HmoA